MAKGVNVEMRVIPQEAKDVIDQLGKVLSGVEFSLLDVLAYIRMALVQKVLSKKQTLRASARQMGITHGCLQYYKKSRYVTHIVGLYGPK